MGKKSSIARYTAEEAARQRSTTDWDRVNAKTAEEIEADAASDEVEDGMIVDWARAEIGLPATKAVLHMRVDRDVLDFFRRGGRGYQTKINAVLRAYMDAHSSE